VSRSQTLVFVQFACIGFFLITGSWWAHSILGLAIELIGIFIGLWAIGVMGRFQLTVFPEPRQNAKLLESGPYAVIRHPMYTSVLLVCGSLAFDRMELEGVAVFAVLLFNQLMKLRYEEKLLRRHFGEPYAEYMQRTSAILPYIF